MKIGVICAMPEEIDLLAADIGINSQRHIGRRDYLCGSLYGKQAVLVLSRIGKVAATSTVTTLINLFDVDLIIFTGVAGAVDARLEVGDVVIASELVQHDLDASALPQFRRFEVPLLDKSHFEASDADCKLAEEAALRYTALHYESARVYRGVVASGDQFIANPAKLDELRRLLPGLLCVEMEGAAVAQVCYEYQKRFVVARVISDRADGNAPADFAKFVSTVAAPISAGLVEELFEALQPG